MAVLRQLHSSDFQVAADFVRAYYAHERLLFDERVANSVAELLANPALGRFWAIEDDGRQLGYLVLTFGFDHEFGGRIGLITDFFLTEPARGNGLGTEAIGLALREAKTLGLKAVELYVLDHNPRAREFYRRQGFGPVVGRSAMSRPL